MSSTISHYGYWGLLLASILSSACIPVPSEIAYGFAGALCTTALTGHARFTLVGVILVGTLGSLIGSVVAYEVGRSAGRTIVDRWGTWLLLTHRDLDAAERWFGRYGSWSVLVGRVIPVVRSFISLPAGIAEMRRAPFAILTTVGSAAWVALLAGLGYAAGANWSHVSHDFHLATWPVVAVIVLGLVAAFWHRLRAVRAQRAQGS